MKSSRLRIALLAFLCGTTSLHADILILNNGNKMEGNILSETPDAIHMRYRLTPKIWDEKSVPRSEIKEIIKQTPQELELIEVRKLLPTRDLMTADEYEQEIQNRLRPFVNKYPGTPEAKEVEEIIATFQKEKADVINGHAKLEGKWLNTGEAKAEKFNIEAFKILSNLRAQAKNGKWSAALQEYDKFAKADPIMRATRYYPTAVSEVLTILEDWSSVLTKMAAEQPILRKNRDEGLRKLEGAEKIRTEEAIRAELDTWRANAADAKSRKLRWIEPYKYDLPSIQVMQKEVNAERAYLQSIDLETLKSQNEAYAAVLAKIGEGDYTGGAAAFGRVSNFAAPSLYKNPAQAKDAKDVVEALKAKLLDIYKQLVAKQNTGTVIKTGSAAIGGTTSVGVDDRVSKILAEARAQSGAPAAAAPAAAAPAPAAPGTQPAVAGVQPAPARPGVPAQAAPAPVAVAPGVNPAVQQPYQVAQATRSAALPPPTPVSLPAEESNLQTYLLIGAGVVILALLIALLGKKK